MIVEVPGAVQELGAGNAMAGYRNALAAIVVASALQILLGVFKAGRLSSFFLASVIHGMLAAIGITIIGMETHDTYSRHPSSARIMKPGHMGRRKSDHYGV